MKKTHLGSLLLIVLCLQATPALAYIGPGLGTGVIASVLGIVAAILMLIVGIVWYPVKRLVKKMRSKEQ